MKTHIPLALILSALPAFARTWTDTTGRTIEADFIRADAIQVTLLFQGRETKVPLTRLSEADLTWIEENKAAPAKSRTDDASKPRSYTLCGATLSPGGPTVTVETPLTPATLRAFRQRKDTPSKLRMAVKLPPGFDPTNPQRVLWVSAAINNDRERKAGNCAAIKGYDTTAASAGWVVIAADTDLGNPRGEDNRKEDDADEEVHQQAVQVLAAAWPGFKTWKFACGGFSGGAKATFFRVGQLFAAGLDVDGMYLGGCNQDMTEAACAEIRFAKSRLRSVRVFISNGKSDPISTVAHAKAVEKKVDANFGTVQLHLFDGGHRIDQGELRKALDWFAAP